MSEIFTLKQTLILYGTYPEGDDLVSVIDYDIFSGLKSKEWIPDSVREHIENGNKALLKYHLKI